MIFLLSEKVFFFSLEIVRTQTIHQKMYNFNFDNLMRNDHNKITQQLSKQIFKPFQLIVNNMDFVYINLFYSF